MDPFIVPLTGAVKHTITIDPTVWIFDNRKVNLDTYFSEFDDNNEFDPDEPITRPRRFQTNQIRTKKEASIEGSYGMVLDPFIENASPLEEAETVVAITSDGEQITAPLETGKKWIACFSEDGKALKKTGPIHIYFQDGSNRQTPVTNVVKLLVK